MTVSDTFGVHRTEAGPLRRLLGKGWAETEPEAKDRKLRTRTYGIPFDRVWNEALRVIERRRWALIRADDQRGHVEATAKTLVLRFVDDVRIAVALDENGQTRVDVLSASRAGWADFGTNARRVRRFLRDLDRALR